ncbi:NAD-dependent dehydratase [Sphingomonas metalli]|uniref:NAD-dependent dehydratase n=2 Tax=Sphingomonas metalli TaxID=1779358 RepID=A0A916WSQ5_9SPHN|nr:NAD-dependent dehydratase [Sphingomonas metalli]
MPDLQGAKIVLDWTSRHLIADLIDTQSIDVIVYLASSMIPSSPAQSYLAERSALVEPFLQLGQIAASRHIPLIYFSSGGAIYGATASGAASESDECAPISFYGQLKLEIEQLVRFLHRTVGLEYIIVRPSNPFGRYQAGDGRQGLIATIFSRVQAGQELEVWGDGRAIRDYIYVDDLVDAVVELAGSGNQRNMTVNVGSGVGYSLLEVVNTVECVLQRPIALHFRPGRATDVSRIVVDTEKLRSLVSVAPRSLEAGIRDFARIKGMIGD